MPLRENNSPISSSTSKDDPSKQSMTTKESKKRQEEEYSPEDLKLKEDLESLVQSILAIKGPDITPAQYEAQAKAIESICQEMQTSTTSMTAIPKPLKFLRPHIPRLRSYYDEQSQDDPAWVNRSALADILSVLCMVVLEDGPVLTYRFDSFNGNFENAHEPIIKWGIAYVQHIAAELSKEYHLIAEQEHRESEALMKADDVSDDADSIPNEDESSELEHDDDDDDDDNNNNGHYTSTTRGTHNTKNTTTTNHDNSSNDASGDHTSTGHTDNDQDKPSDAQDKGKSTKKEEPSHVPRSAPSTKASLDDITRVALSILSHLLSHGCETDAIDMLMEIGSLDAITPYVDDDNFEDVTLYIDACAQYSGDIDEQQRVYELLLTTYLQLKQYTYALATALRIVDNKAAVSRVFQQAVDMEEPHVQLSLAHIISRGCNSLQYLYDIVNDDATLEVIQRGHCGVLSQEVLTDIGVTASKKRDDVCRAGEVDEPAEWVAVGLANLGTRLLDCLGTTSAASPEVLLSKAVATGTICAGDFEDGYTHADTYMSSTDNITRIGGIIATGLAGSGVNNDFNAGMALLSDYVTDDSYDDRTRGAACFAIGLCYLDSRDEEIRELLVPILLDGSLNEYVTTMAGFALSLLFIGSGDADLIRCLITAANECTTVAYQRLLAVCCGFIVLGNGGVSDEITEALQDAELVRDYAAVIVDGCAHVGTGNMLLVQQLLHAMGQNDPSDKDDEEDDDDEDDGFSDTLQELQAMVGGGAGGAAAGLAGLASKKKKDSGVGDDNASNSASTASSEKDGKTVQISKDEQIARVKRMEMKQFTRSISVLSIALISVRDELTSSLCQRMLQHLLECGSTSIRRGVPSAIALLNASRPSPTVTDTLIRLTHDFDHRIAMASTLSLGISAAGSNNSRAIAGISGVIADTREKSVIRIGRLSQGLSRLGCGTVTLSPTWLHDTNLHYHALACLIFLSTSMLENNCGLLTTHLEVWGIVAACARTKVMNTIDTDGNNIQIPVKIGNVVGGGVLGRKTVLSGIQVTHTPVIVNTGQTVQVDDDDYQALTHCLEGTVVIQKKSE